MEFHLHYLLNLLDDDNPRKTMWPPTRPLSLSTKWLPGYQGYTKDNGGHAQYAPYDLHGTIQPFKVKTHNLKFDVFILRARDRGSNPKKWILA